MQFLNLTARILNVFIVLLIVLLDNNAAVNAKSRPKRACEREEFACNSGQCIEAGLECDGFIQCFDGSDESSQLCSNTICPIYMFRCNYGACVTISSICNGKADCWDRSDEPPNHNCKLPSNTHKYADEDVTTQRYTPFVVPSQTNSPSTRPYKPPFAISTPPSAVTDGHTTKRYTPFALPSTPNQTPPTARPTAPSTSHTTTNANSNFGQCQLPEQTSERTYSINECARNPNSAACQAKPGDYVNFGSVLYFQCESKNYTYVNDIFSAYCFDGKWTPQITPCKSCGTWPSATGPNGYIPWQAIIYRKSNADICWGSIISPYVLITAAHCFYDPSVNSKKDVTDYYVHLGRDARSLRSANSRQYNVTNVIFSPQDGFQGPISYYASDIAIVEISPSIQFNEDVIPVCLEVDDGPQNEIKSGLISSLRTINNNVNFKTETVKFMNLVECLRAVSEPFQQIVKTDKLCIIGANVEANTDGKGLYTKRNGESAYRLRGVFSSIFIDSINNSQQVLAITDVRKHLSWLNSIVNDINQRRRTEDVINIRFPTTR